MKRTLLYSLILSIFVTGCQKDIDGELPGDDDNNPRAADTYLPLTKGTTWKYKETGFADAEYTMTVTDRKQTVNNINFTVVTSDFQGTVVEGLMAQKGANYYIKQSGNSPNTGASFDFTMLFLNDKEAAGYTWDFNGGQGGGFTAKIPGKIIERDLSMTVAGKNYTNVIHTQLTLAYEMPVVGTTDFMIYDYYVAKGVGIIKIDSETPPGIPVSVTSVVELQDYSIK
ncbi:hypothetical protein [Pseudoflavitalea rhizosphaerae]|uniref:hypothetical protein n=1 Tax=Pseudoflavitalea rhizosphaerae TaxID=1884793 RepID=UPI000F8F5A6F|nr:hypothetical protein [Pseudoflavitalea rhizosphaerae]